MKIYSKKYLLKQAIINAKFESNSSYVDNFNFIKPGARRSQAGVHLVFRNHFRTDICMCAHPQSHK